MQLYSLGQDSLKESEAEGEGGVTMEPPVLHANVMRQQVSDDAHELQ